jgi:uncharacterized membrane protein (UPF0182 family)
VNPRRRLAVTAMWIAGLVLLARAAAIVYVDHAWYAALAAEPLWRARAVNTMIVFVVAALTAFGFSYVNLLAVRRSIASLILPRRMGNVEIAEAVTPRSLDRSIWILALVIAAMSLTAAPSWLTLARARAGISFNESDPYYSLDLGFFVAMLPLEREAYLWTLSLFTTVALVVTVIYAFTPGLRWHAGALRVSTYVRRHLSLLAAGVLLLLAWSYRLETYDLLIDGGGANGFGYSEHHWILPAQVVVLLSVTAAALVIAWSGWTGQTAITFAVVSVVLVLVVGARLVVPLLATRIPTTSAKAKQDAPYLATRAAYTSRAFDRDTSHTPGHPLTDSLAALVAQRYPNALVPTSGERYEVMENAASLLDPRLATTPMRLASIFALRRPAIWEEATGRDVRLVQYPGARERVQALAPGFALGSTTFVLYHGDSVVWVNDVYSASTSFPLTAHRLVGNERYSYFRHAAVAYVNAHSGRVTLVPDREHDAIARGWIAMFPSQFATRRPSFLDELSTEPHTLLPDTARTATSADSAFRSRVRRYYDEMRSALRRGDFARFGALLDSLGALVGEGVK